MVHRAFNCEIQGVYVRMSNGRAGILLGRSVHRSPTRSNGKGTSTTRAPVRPSHECARALPTAHRFRRDPRPSTCRRVRRTWHLALRTPASFPPASLSSKGTQIADVLGRTDMKTVWNIGANNSPPASQRTHLRTKAPTPEEAENLFFCCPSSLPMLRQLSRLWQEG